MYSNQFNGVLDKLKRQVKPQISRDDVSMKVIAFSIVTFFLFKLKFKVFLKQNLN